MGIPTPTGRGRRLCRALPAVTVLLCLPACAPQVVQGVASPASTSASGQEPGITEPPTGSISPPTSAAPPTSRAPTPPPPAPPDGPAGVERFLGRTLEEDPELRNYLDRNCGPGGSTWICRTEATELTLDSDFRVTSVWMKSPEASPPTGYIGPLPFDISFGDSADRLLARFGPPVAGRAEPNWYATWPVDDVELTVHFMRDPPARIQKVQLAIP